MIYINEGLNFKIFRIFNFSFTSKHSLLPENQAKICCFQHICNPALAKWDPFQPKDQLILKRCRE